MKYTGGLLDDWSELLDEARLVGVVCLVDFLLFEANIFTE